MLVFTCLQWIKSILLHIALGIVFFPCLVIIFSDFFICGIQDIHGPVTRRTSVFQCFHGSMYSGIWLTGVAAVLGGYGGLVPYLTKARLLVRFVKV